jgi:hypothetical protein
MFLRLYVRLGVLVNVGFGCMLHEAFCWFGTGGDLEGDGRGGEREEESCMLEMEGEGRRGMGEEVPVLSCCPVVFVFCFYIYTMRNGEFCGLFLNFISYS